MQAGHKAHRTAECSPRVVSLNPDLRPTPKAVSFAGIVVSQSKIRKFQLYYTVGLHFYQDATHIGLYEYPKLRLSHFHFILCYVRRMFFYRNLFLKSILIVGHTFHGLMIALWQWREREHVFGHDKAVHSGSIKFQTPVSSSKNGRNYAALELMIHYRCTCSISACVHKALHLLIKLTVSTSHQQIRIELCCSHLYQLDCAVHAVIVCAGEVSKPQLGSLAFGLVKYFVLLNYYVLFTLKRDRRIPYGPVHVCLSRFPQELGYPP